MEISALELSLLTGGSRFIAGCDEVGRGALAGPVVAGAVVLSYDKLPQFLMDSKRLTKRRRELTAAEIKECSIAYATYLIEPREIERINILQSSLKAMGLAVGKLGIKVDAILVDGKFAPQLEHPTVQAIVDGDAQIACIAAASIIAKVERDFIMDQYARLFPRYHFENNRGYGTHDHLAALARYGPCRLHRKTFKPVREQLFPTLFRD